MRSYRSEEKNSPTMTQKVFFWTTLLKELLLHKAALIELRNEIITNLHLGTLPLEKDVELIKDEIPKLSLIVSLVEIFELAGKGIFPIKTPSLNQWGKNREGQDIKHYSLPIPDLTTMVDIEKLNQVINKIFSTIEKKRSVYVHCKAGRGRSAMVVFFFLLFSWEKLLQQNLLLLDDAAYFEKNKTCLGSDDFHAKYMCIFNFIQSKRPQIGLEEQGIENLYKQLKSLRENLPANIVKAENNELSGTLNEKLKQYLSSNEGKENIEQLMLIKEILKYAAQMQPMIWGESNRDKLITEFFDKIKKGDISWYTELMTGQGPLKDLLEYVPTVNKFFGGGEAKTRKELVGKLKEELTEYLTRQLHCTREELHTIIKEFENNTLTPMEFG